MVQQQLAVNRPDWEGMTVRIAVPIAADASSLVTLHAGTSCEQGVNGQLTHQAHDNYQKPTSWRHFREMPTIPQVINPPTGLTPRQTVHTSAVYRS